MNWKFLEKFIPPTVVQEKIPVPHLLVFGASFCLMVVELVAGRLIAPYMGVSVYTWTSVIGTVLLGVALGNYAGGVFADRYGSRARLGMTWVFAGVAVLLIAYLAPLLGDSNVRYDFPLWFQTFAFSLIVFFPAAFFLSAVAPQVMKSGVRASATVGSDRSPSHWKTSCTMWGRMPLVCSSAWNSTR